jgi:hypothetical protein
MKFQIMTGRKHGYKECIIPSLILKIAFVAAGRLLKFSGRPACWPKYRAKRIHSVHIVVFRVVTKSNPVGAGTYSHS